MDQKFSFLQDLRVPNMLLAESESLEKLLPFTLEKLDKMCYPNMSGMFESIKYVPSIPIITSLLPNLTVFNCDNCFNTFDNIFTLIQHDFEHSKNLPLQCGACGRRFSTFIDLRSHINLVHLEISCDDLEVKKEHDDGNSLHSMLDCNKCERNFDSCSNWTQICTKHYFEQHSQFYKDIECCTLAIKEGGSSCPQYHLNCPICYEQFNNMLELECHKYTHIASGMKKCKLCHVWIGSTLHLKEHLKYHQENFEITNWFSVEGLLSECDNILPNSIVARLQWLLYKIKKINSQISHPFSCQIMDVDETFYKKSTPSYENNDCSLMLETKINRPTSDMNIHVQQLQIQPVTVADYDSGNTAELFNENANFYCDSSSTSNNVIHINNQRHCAQQSSIVCDKKYSKVMEYNCNSNKLSNFITAETSSKANFLADYECKESNVQTHCKKTKLIDRCDEATTFPNNGSEEKKMKEKSDLSSTSIFEFIGKGTFGNYSKWFASCPLKSLQDIDEGNSMLSIKPKSEIDMNLDSKSEINNEPDKSTNLSSAIAQEFKNNFDLKKSECDAAFESCVDFKHQIKLVPDKEIDNRTNDYNSDIVPTEFVPSSSHLETFAFRNSECKVSEGEDVVFEKKIPTAGQGVNVNNVEDKNSVTGCVKGLEDLISHFSRFLEDDDCGNEENTITIFSSDLQESKSTILTGNADKKPTLCSSGNPYNYSSNLTLSDLNLTSIIEEEKENVETINYMLSPERRIYHSDFEHQNNSYVNFFTDTENKADVLPEGWRDISQTPTSNVTTKRPCEEYKNLIVDDNRITNEMSMEHSIEDDRHYNLRNDYNRKYYKCKVCGKKLQNFSMQMDHKRVHKIKLKLYCKDCELKFQDHNKYLFHLTTHRPKY